MKIINNFLPSIAFDFLNERLLDKYFPWYHQNSKVLDDDNEEQFTHLFYSDATKYSGKENLLEPVFDIEYSKLTFPSSSNLDTFQ